MKFTTLILGVIAMAPIGRSAARGYNPDGKHPASHKVVVADVIQTTNYTYLQVKENDSLKWLAVPAMQASKGETYYYSEGLPMQQFESKELHRKFDLVLFLGGVSTYPIGSKPPVNPHATAANEPYTRKATPNVKKDIKMTIPADCVSIADLMTKKDSYNGKIVKVTGQVTKYSPEIMNKNWVHIQDGTQANGKFDLTITTSSAVKQGDIVTFEGKISLNKDFGYGYVFDVMMEDATTKQSQK